MLHSSERIIKHKLGLPNLTEELGNLSRACKFMGLSRDTFYRYWKVVEEDGIDALLEPDRRRPNHKNRVAPDVEEAVAAYAIDFPAHDQVRGSKTNCVNGGFLPPPAECAASNCATNWPTSGAELKALEAKMAAEEGLMLTNVC